MRSRHALSLCCCAGANDYFSIVFQNTTVTAEAVTGYIENAMLTLYAKGARKYAKLPSAPCTLWLPASLCVAAQHAQHRARKGPT